MLFDPQRLANVCPGLSFLAMVVLSLSLSLSLVFLFIVVVVSLIFEFSQAEETRQGSRGGKQVWLCVLCVCLRVCVCVCVSVCLCLRIGGACYKSAASPAGGTRRHRPQAARPDLRRCPLRKLAAVRQRCGKHSRHGRPGSRRLELRGATLAEACSCCSRALEGRICHRLLGA